jgi:predicted AAA+ superfamily ATPase
VIERARHRTRIGQLLANQPVVGILGALQVGKTTLARQVEADLGGEVHHLDLEDPDTLAAPGTQARPGGAQGTRGPG